ncbi:hypothetical protein D3C72_1418840 [compost metagenome]
MIVWIIHSAEIILSSLDNFIEVATGGFITRALAFTSIVKHLKNIRIHDAVDIVHVKWNAYTFVGTSKIVVRHVGIFFVKEPGQKGTSVHLSLHSIVGMRNAVTVASFREFIKSC